MLRIQAISSIRYLFRHDREQDYLISLLFATRPDLRKRHASEPNFVGVYILLAERVDDKVLEELLMDIALSAGEAEEIGVLSPLVRRLRAVGRVEQGEMRAA